MIAVTDQLAANDLDDAADATVADRDDAEPGGSAATRRFGRGPKRPRISKWDRPPDPHDWRYFVGTLGKILIATGLLMFGFVAYQLWGTGIETARAQDRLENQFEQLLVDNGVVVDEVPTVEPGDVATDVDPATAEEIDADDPGAATQVDDPGDDGPGADPQIAGPITQAVPIAVDLSDQAVEQDPIPQPLRGDPLLRLEIPRIGRDDIVVPGVTLNDLKSGPGHYPETPLPGQLGNAAIAGHRTTYGAPFINVDRLQPGDEIITTLLNGDRFVYEVTFVEVVEASDYRVVTTSDPNIAELTLTSCHPKYTAQKRIVVHSVLNPDKSSNVGFPTFYELEPEPEPTDIPGDDPVLGADDIEITAPSSALGELDQAGAEATADRPEGTGDGAVDGVDEAGSTEVSTDEPAAGVVDEPSNDGGSTAPAGEPIDAFSQGWFGDREAFPQIALWGMALTIISLLSYQVSKKFRHDSIGFLVGILPFLFALYFFFQNVNRLLPPGI